MGEMDACDRKFYSLWQVFRRVTGSFVKRRRFMLSLVGNLSFRKNGRLNHNNYGLMDLLSEPE
jgi:hypothetical protein